MSPIAFLIALLVASMLALGGCGVGDDEDSDAPAPFEITIGEFIALIQPEKQQVLEAFVAQSEACKDVTVNPSFALVVTAAGLEAESASPLPELIEAQC